MQPPRPHSLIHRQTPEVMPAEGSASTTPSTASAPAPRSLQRKLTKRPAQAPVAAPSSDAVASQTTAPSSQPVSPIQTNTTRSGSRLSMAATGLAALGASSLATAPVTTAGPANAPSSVTTAPTSGKTPMASAVPGVGPGATVPAGSTATGRGLQRLTTQMPGLTQLMAPTVSVSSPPPTPSPSPGVSQSPSTSSSSSSSSPSTSSSPISPPPPPPSPPPGTGSATLSWTLNSETNLAGYKIYVGTAPGLYTYPGSPFAVGVTSSYTITGLPVGQTYYFAISAFDYSGGESALSAEVSKSIY